MLLFHIGPLFSSSRHVTRCQQHNKNWCLFVSKTANLSLFFSKNIAEQSLRTKTLKKTIFVIFLFNIYSVDVAKIINESNFGFWKSIKCFAHTPQLTFILHRISSWDFQICSCCFRSTLPVGRIPGPGMS